MRAPLPGLRAVSFRMKTALSDVQHPIIAGESIRFLVLQTIPVSMEPAMNTVAGSQADMKRTVMEIIADLPQDILKWMVQEWLQLKDIARMDSAACCRLHRQGLLFRLYNDTVRFYQYNRKYSYALETWVLGKLPVTCQSISFIMLCTPHEKNSTLPHWIYQELVGARTGYCS
jgi:hypothetical protein